MIIPTSLFYLFWLENFHDVPISDSLNYCFGSELNLLRCNGSTWSSSSGHLSISGARVRVMGCKRPKHTAFIRIAARSSLIGGLMLDGGISAHRRCIPDSFGQCRYYRL
jgi:hypothetical protein